jgi:hypothetical protein
MRQNLLFVGAVVHALGVLFHLALPRLVVWHDVLRGLPQTQQGYLHLFNAHVAYALLIFAVLSFAYPRELLSTPIGRAVTVLIVGFWLLRAASEFIWLPTISPLILTLCLSMACLYAFVAFGARLQL